MLLYKILNNLQYISLCQGFSLMIDPLFNPNWIEFNQCHWNLKAELIELNPPKGTSWSLKTVIYFNRNGQIVTPPRNPHIPIEFHCSSNKPSSINRRKRIAFTEIARLYNSYRLGSNLVLSPVVNDIRPFQWEGMVASPRFTYHLNLVNYTSLFDSSILKISRKAKFLGYVCEETKDYDAVQECLKASENRKGFSHQVDALALEKLSNLIGDEGFVCFLCRSPFGDPVGARVALYVPGGMALAWSAGVKNQALKDGVNNLLGEYALKFFSAKKCSIFDFVGANIPSVATMKESWGGDLICYYAVCQRNFRNIAKDTYLTFKKYFLN